MATPTSVGLPGPGIGGLTVAQNTQLLRVIQNAIRRHPSIAYLESTMLIPEGTSSGGAAFSAVKVKRGSAVSVPNSAWTVMNWDVEEFDTDSYHDTGSNTNRITIPSGFGGKFLVMLGGGWAGNATGLRGMQIAMNTTTANTNVIADDGIVGFTGMSNPLETVVLVSLVAGDWLSVNVFQSSGAALNWDPGAGRTFFIVQRIAD